MTGSAATLPSVSVALCTYNGAEFVEEQVRSILAQSIAPAQIVVSDDGSTDGTIDIVRRVLAEAPHIRSTILTNPEPLGVVANFEQATRACDGDLVALCDQDDVWHSDRVEVAVTRFAQFSELALVHSDARLIDGRGVPLGHSLFDALGISREERAAAASGDELPVLLQRNLVTGATAMVARRVVDAAVPYPELWIHDEWLAMIAACIGGSELIDRELVDYRQHGGNQIGVTKLGLRGKFGRLIEPRNGRNVYLRKRAQLLLDRLEQLGELVRPGALTEVRSKVDHLAARARYPRARLARLGPLVREVRTGRYARYSRGWADVLRDAVQPAGDERDAGERIVTSKR